ncbi:MAG: hypothetical protein KDC53_05395 [Saprospiraceae bacterium]|nr:hypothetical protein [Saprospiraceae bacterium]
MNSSDYTCRAAKLLASIMLYTLSFFSIITAANARSFYTVDVRSMSQASDVHGNYSASSKEKAISKTDIHPNPIQFLGIPDDIVLNCGESIPDWPEVTARDDQKNYVVTAGEEIQFTPCGGRIIHRTWIVTNSDGEKIERNQTITFTDNISPILEVAKDTTISSSREIPVAKYEASDQGCSSFTVDISEDAYRFEENMTTIVRRYTATDGCGNSTSKVQHIYVTSEANQKSGKSKTVSVLEYK